MSTRFPTIGGLALAAWGGAVALAGASGLTAAIPAMAMGPAVGATVATAILVSRAVPAIRRTLDRIPLRALTAVHILRIGPGLGFLAAGANGVLPPVFAHRVGYGDVLAGLFAAIAVILPPSRARLLAVNLFGAADLLDALVTAMLLTLQNDTRMTAMRDLPFVLIALWVVPILGALHATAFARLARRAAVTA